LVSCLSATTGSSTGFCSVIGGPFYKLAFGNAILEDILGVADAIVSDIGNQGKAPVIFLV
jgi:hypothetical protein